MFKGACRLDDPAHRTIILADPRRVNDIPLRFACFCFLLVPKPLSTIDHGLRSPTRLELILLSVLR
jgi:hypothetical protein